MSEQERIWKAQESFHYENGYYLTSHPSRVGKLLAHYELYREITHLPGDVFEFGVFKGTSMARWLTFRHLLEADHSRKIYGFDTFDAFPQQDSEEDQQFVEGFTQEAGKPLSQDTLDHYFQHKGFGNYQFIAGDITLSLPQFLSDNPHKRAAMIHIDVDVYEPSRVILEQMYDKLVPGGLIVLDDYGTVAGETKAVDAFMKAHGLRIEKLPLNYIPAFIRKP